MVLYDKFMAQYRRILVGALASLHRDHFVPDERMFTARRTRHDRTDFGGFAAETGPRYATPLRRGNVTRAAANTLSNVALAPLTCWHRASRIDDRMFRTSQGKFIPSHRARMQKLYLFQQNILELQNETDRFAGKRQEL